MAGAMSSTKTIVCGIEVPSLDHAMNAILERAKQEIGFSDPSYISHKTKRDVIEFVISVGGLNLRNAVNDLSRYLKLSRTSVYSVINDSYHKESHA